MNVCVCVRTLPTWPCTGQYRRKGGRRRELGPLPNGRVRSCCQCGVVKNYAQLGGNESRPASSSDHQSVYHLPKPSHNRTAARALSFSSSSSGSGHQASHLSKCTSVAVRLLGPGQTAAASISSRDSALSRPSPLFSLRPLTGHSPPIRTYLLHLPST